MRRCLEYPGRPWENRGRERAGSGSRTKEGDSLLFITGYYSVNSRPHDKASSELCQSKCINDEKNCFTETDTFMLGTRTI